MSKPVVVVVGGGLSGLAGALHLARRGISVTVLEKSAAAGGRARTHTSGGYVFNLGPHALLSRSRQALRELDVSFSAHVPPGGHMIRGGHRHTFPAGPLSLLTTGLLSLGGRIEAVRWLAGLGRLETDRFDSMSLSEFLGREVSRDDVRQMLRAFVRIATYGDDPERMSAGAALDQLKSAAQNGVSYVDGGWQALVDGLLLRAREAGIDVQLRASAAEVTQEGRLGVRLADGGFVCADAVLLAVDPGTAARLVPGSDALAQAAREAIPVRVASLDLALKRLPRPDALFALAVDRPVYFSVHSASARLAPAGGALLHAMMYLGAGRPSDTEAVEHELAALVDEMQPGWPQEVVVRRFAPDLVVSNALVTRARGGLRGRPPVAVADCPGIYVAGDWVGSEGQLADASLLSAQRAAAAIASALPSRLAA